MKPIIESLQNPKIKLVQRLRDSRVRRQSGQILIDGLREIEVARKAGLAIEAIFCTSESMASAEAAAFFEQWPPSLLQPVGERVFEKIAYGQRMSYAVALAAAPRVDLDELSLPPQPLVLVLDQVEKPGNIGAVARTAATAGADALILCDPVCEVFNPNAIRASLGTVFSLPIAVASGEQFRGWIERQQMRLVRACVDGSVDMWQADLRGSLAILLGSEAHGLGQQWNQTQWPAVQIPMRSGSDSLNLSVSAAVLCYEALRQRRASERPASST